MNWLGVILAGGAGRRMGTDKALVEVEDRPMVEWVVEALTPVVDRVIVAGRTGNLQGLKAIPDSGGRYRGPLAGLEAASNYAPDAGLLAVAVDHPFVRTETLVALAERLEDRAVVPLAGDTRQVTCAAYPGAWSVEFSAELEAGGSVQTVLDRLPFDGVPEAEWRTWGEDGRSWFSADTAQLVEQGVTRFLRT